LKYVFFFLSFVRRVSENGAFWIRRETRDKRKAHDFSANLKSTQEPSAIVVREEKTFLFHVNARVVVVLRHGAYARKRKTNRSSRTKFDGTRMRPRRLLFLGGRSITVIARKRFARVLRRIITMTVRFRREFRPRTTIIPLFNNNSRSKNRYNFFGYLFFWNDITSSSKTRFKRNPKSLAIFAFSYRTSLTVRVSAISMFFVADNIFIFFVVNKLFRNKTESAEL